MKGGAKTLGGGIGGETVGGAIVDAAPPRFLGPPPRVPAVLCPPCYEPHRRLSRCLMKMLCYCLYRESPGGGHVSQAFSRLCRVTG